MKRETDYHKTAIRIPDDLYNRMLDHATSLGVSVTSYICIAIGEKLNTYEKVNNLLKPEQVANIMKLMGVEYRGDDN